MISNLVLLAVIAASMLMTVFGIMFYKAWRKRDARRSPLHGKTLHHTPGQQLVERAAGHGDDMLLSVIVMYISAPMMLLAWSMVRVRWEDVRFNAIDLTFVFGALGFFAYGLRRFIQHDLARERARDGLIAERMTGQQLNRLAGPRCIVLHDVPCEGFNIDHVVIAPRAVYAVETKSYRKPRGSGDDSHYKVTWTGDALLFATWRTSKPIEQARRQSQWLARYLRDSLGTDVTVVPAVSLPGWYIERSSAAERSDVKVFTPMGRGADFLTKAPDLIDERQRALIAQALALRYPQIEQDRQGTAA